MSDWTGNSNSVFKCLGTSNHTENVREINDYYATDPKAIDILCSEEKFVGDIWECSTGEGHLSKRLEVFGYNVKSTDLIDRGYGEGNINFLKCNTLVNCNIITNPPYKYLLEFMKKALSLIPIGKKVCFFCKLQHLEGQKRGIFFRENPPQTVYILSSRIDCALNGDFASLKKRGGSAQAYCWIVWEKGFNGNTQIKWVN